ncbi:MAG: hypothetical protein U1E03_15750, partial [Hyphomonadaceae bacterium]
ISRAAAISSSVASFKPNSAATPQILPGALMRPSISAICATPTITQPRYLCWRTSLRWLQGMGLGDV